MGGKGCTQMTPAEHQHRRHWQLMTYPERLRFVSVLFSSGPVGDVVWHTAKPFDGYHEWWIFRWDGPGDPSSEGYCD